MNDSEILAIYMAQSENVRHLKKVIDSYRRDINLDLRKSNDFQINAKTKIMALLYSAWSEAQLLQIAYTPNGFSSTEIQSIIQAKNNGITQAWKKMINLAFQKIGDPNTDPNIKTRLDKLLLLVKTHIDGPSKLRNKIAHGQWVKALNSSSTGVNSDLTNKLDQLDSVQIRRQLDMHQFLGKLIRDLTQSPNNGFGRDYLKNIADLENFTIKSQHWSIQAKKIALLRKPIKYAQV
ncbi:hypothetical protein [Pantoea sp. Ap-967]|uniref:hypothetical protein n=1 Tax=Gammaproteobacteria TaxID=1236 RepID=UPI001423A844|nr:hypothetical protein [Pantoea sp. Ap-967]NIE75532.1 hypothetical protein [Pantoea sp. Ap-967]